MEDHVSEIANVPKLTSKPGPRRADDPFEMAPRCCVAKYRYVVVERHFFQRHGRRIRGVMLSQGGVGDFDQNFVCCRATNNSSQRQLDFRKVEEWRGDPVQIPQEVHRRQNAKGIVVRPDD
ncbi:hypothetical protein D3C71_1446450 [compost metagenome]